MIGIVEVLIISSVILFISMYLFKFSLGTYSITRLNMISVIFYKDFILLTFIGAILVVCNVDIKQNLYFWGVTNHAFDSARFYGWISVLYAMVLFPLGMILSNVIFFKKIKIKLILSKYFSAQTKMYLSRTDNAVFITCCIFLLISTLAVIYVYVCIGNFPILSLFSGAENFILAQLRSDAKLNFSGIAAIKDVLAINLTMLLSYILYTYSKVTNLLKYNILFYYSFFLFVLIITYNLEKIPLFFYFFGFVLLNVLISSKVSLKKILLFFIFVFISLIGLYFLFLKKGLGIVIISILSRIFVAESAAIFLAYEYVPNSMDFIGVKGISNLFAALVGEKRTMYGRSLFELYNPSAVLNNTAGYIVGLFTTEAWVLFGILGVLLSPLYVGFFVQSFHNILLKLPKTPIFMGAYVFITLKWSLTGGVSQFLYPIILFVMVFLIVQLILVSNMFQKLKK